MSRYGNVQIGAMNAGHAHFATDRSNFWFQKQIQVNGDIIDYRNKAKFVTTAGATFTGGVTFNKNTIKVIDHLQMKAASRSDWNTYLSSDGNGFTRLGGQFGVGFMGNSANGVQGDTRKSELMRITSHGNDLKGSALLRVGSYRKGQSQIDIGSHGSIMNRNGHYGDATYYSCGAKFVHTGKDYIWQNTFTGFSSVMAAWTWLFSGILVLVLMKIKLSIS